MLGTMAEISIYGKILSAYKGLKVLLENETTKSK